MKSPKKTILVVEDNTFLMNAYEIKLSHEGYAVIRAENGKGALEVLHKDRPDLIILDLLMPVMDGMTFLERMRALPETQSIPVIIFTNSDPDKSTRDKAKEFGIEEFFLKTESSLRVVADRISEILKK